MGSAAKTVVYSSLFLTTALVLTWVLFEPVMFLVYGCRSLSEGEACAHPGSQGWRCQVGSGSGSCPPQPTPGSLPNQQLECSGLGAAACAGVRSAPKCYSGCEGDPTTSVRICVNYPYYNCQDNVYQEPCYHKLSQFCTYQTFPTTMCKCPGGFAPDSDWCDVGDCQQLP
jgi:hypothetical protein